MTRDNSAAARDRRRTAAAERQAEWDKTPDDVKKVILQNRPGFSTRELARLRDRQGAKA